MFRRSFVNSQNEMENEILNFVSYVANIPYSNIMKVPAADNYNTIWFCRDSVAGGISAWATDRTDNVNYPWQSSSTYALAARYVLDMDRQELDVKETNKAKDEKRKELAEQFQDMYDAEKKAGFVGCPTSKAWYANALKELEEDDSYNVYETKTYRVHTTNTFHVGGVLNFNSLGSNKAILDMHYTENVFSFNLFSYGDKPSVARHLIIGCYRNYCSPQSQRIFIMANVFRCKSDTKYGRYNDCFFLERGYKTLPDVTADLPGEERLVRYNNEIFSMVKLYVDNQKFKDEETYSVNGTPVSMQWHVNPIYLAYWEENDFSVREIRSPLLVAWIYHQLHSTYENIISEFGADYASINSYINESYKVWDGLRKNYKTFSSNKRSAVTDTVNKSANNNSLILPLIFYCLRDPECLDTWSAVGQCDVINYVNMYNMGNGRIFQTSYDRSVPEFANYDLYKRRPKATESALKFRKEPKDAVTETWGYSGYVGLSVKVDRHGGVSF